MILKVCILALAGAAAARFALLPVAMFQPRQEHEDTMDLYLCSNPDFNHDCAVCACERLANLTTSGGYSGPPCCMPFFFFLVSYFSTFHSLPPPPSPLLLLLFQNLVITPMYLVVRLLG